MIYKILLLMLMVSCGKIQEVQDSFIAMSGNNSLTQVDVRIGFLERSPNGTLSDDVVEFENTQYRVMSINPEVASSYQQFPRGQRIPVYFKGSFARRSGLMSTNPSMVVDAVALEAIIQR
ncbi:MAG: hypothetical protein LW878_09945 [Proteobacteria bacterium]|jgi:hypothetical protein|nr:hypothetical protein [Pseudomonadota bacterium]